MKNPQKLLSMSALALPLILASQSVQAASIVASDDNFVLKVNGNAGATNTVQNENGDLVIKNATNNIRESWLKFDLTGQNVDFSQSGTITLTLASNSSSDATFDISLYALDDTGTTAPTWTESTIHWNNAPGNDTSGNGLESGETTFLGATGTIATSTAAGTQYQFTITDWSDYLQSDNTITTIAISTINSTGPSIVFASSENATEAWRPTLTFTQIPEPGSFALLSGMLALTWGALGRRRVQ
ncbi:DNRLRE domain-containing protein [Coraliomargarita sp. SDUM461003]|uniref:DNRLRE domain-containing protein n=1 Tax=Thalassobacterium maritimum TaxID=3041265 RepID=A0ABU1AUJ0_9BACT|nr:DNRLRE domain-containing protein [Coraliomargarita sp. SDUM461003]MDQ8207302.1 DNRLRE domain-containing protein [Coraliomargarita sp. SDUM461003]